jgi:pimeloyl-ACP methyl ester carboxylesterase
MPRVLAKRDDIAFMIAVSCPSVPGVEQGIYLLTAQAVCAGYPKEDANQLEQKIRAYTMARTYDEYLRHKAPLVEIPAFKSLTKLGLRFEVASEEDWDPPDPERDYYGFDPMEIIRRTTIPILAFFGDRDTQVDPVRGAQTYREVLRRAGNPYSRVELIEGVDHNILVSETGCIEERNKRSRSGWTHYAPEYLDIIEEWLTARPR